jgi:DNA-binding LytR/AlgR family response regulator
MTHPVRILILEDEPFLSSEIEEIVAETLPAVVVVKTSVRETQKIIDLPFDFAFLDVDVTNGKTYEVAKQLEGKSVPYAFVSGSEKSHLPEELQNTPFIAKPFRPIEIKTAVLEAAGGRKSAS